jgi:hypothetical protein
MISNNFKSPSQNLIKQSISTSSQNSQVNENLFFLQKTLIPNHTISKSSFNLESTINTHLPFNSSYVNLNSNFLHKIYYLSLSKNNIPSSTNTNNYNIFNEHKYTLGTHLNPQFNNNLTFTTTLNDLNTNSTYTSHDPMLSEVLTTNYNNIAKQQR